MRISDWSSDVCSSDLAHLQAGLDLLQNGFRRGYRLPRALRPRILAMIDGDIAEAGLPDAVAKQFAAHVAGADAQRLQEQRQRAETIVASKLLPALRRVRDAIGPLDRSGEHTSELQSPM